MSKIAITYGDFDCFNVDHSFLIKEMRKIVMPDNKLIAIVPDDYPAFFQKEFFPIQDIKQRMKNLSFLVDEIRICLSNDPTSLMFEVISNLKKQGHRVIYVGYDDMKDFPGKEAIIKHKIPIRFIKKYGQKT